MRFSAFLAAALFAGTALAVCPPAYIISPGDTFEKPDAAFTKLEVINTSSNTVLTQVPLHPNGTPPATLAWTVSLKDIDALRSLVTGPQGSGVRLRWSGGGQECVVPFSVTEAAETDGDVQTPEAAPVTSGDDSACSTAGEAWRAKLSPIHRNGRFAIIILNEDNQVCYTNPELERQSQGDPIYVGVFTGDSYVWASPRFTPCSLATSTPRFNAPASGTAVFGLISGRQAGRRVVLPKDPPSPQRCYDESVEVAIDGKVAGGGSAAQALRYNLRQYPRYHFTLQLGAYNSPEAEHTYALRNAGGQNVIYDQGPTNSGPEYFASVVIYAVPRYLVSLRRNASLYAGRDLVHDQQPLDRVSLILGTGLSSPAQHLVLGFGFEVVNGVNITYTYNTVRVQTLASGLLPGDPFAGTAQEIPLTKAWLHDWAWGVSLDLGYAMRIFSR